MITNLLIQDYALIENIEINFDKGLNIITGETGAGKSILINALGLLLGERANIEVVRKGSKKSVVEGTFTIRGNEKVNLLLDENEIEREPELIVRREISLKGNNRCFINDTPVNLQLIKQIGDLLIDLHGQHEHQSILKSDTHIEMLDEFIDFGGTLTQYREGIAELSRKREELKELKDKEETLREKKKLYKFEIKEIDEISPEKGEDEKLERELNILENSEFLLNSSNLIYESLYESEEATYNHLVRIYREINRIAEIDNELSDKAEEFNSAIAIIEDIAEFIRSYRDKIDLDPENLEFSRERLQMINRLKKKYGPSLENVLSYREKITEEFDLAENFSDRIEELENKIKELQIELGEKAADLSLMRKEKSNAIAKEIEEVLKHLGITDSSFELKITREPAQNGSAYLFVDDKKFAYDKNGIDRVEFYIATNAGEDLKPLVKIASGGEISRVMLALKTVLAKNDKLPLLVFDEIDTGISGRVAQKVGYSLKELAEFHQIIAITHLPQIAGVADHHFAVEKNKIADRVISSIRKLENDERITEVAKLISGEELSEAALKGARELMGITG